jgi:hypothetical protein
MTRLGARRDTGVFLAYWPNHRFQGSVYSTSCIDQIRCRR